MSKWPATFIAMYCSLVVAVGIPLGLGGCQVLLTQLNARQGGVRLETTITWKQEVLARPLLDVQVHNVTEVTVSAVAVTCEFEDEMGAMIFRGRAFLPEPLQVGETQHLNGGNFQGLSRFERARCESEGV